jgi:hypothetical protein
VVDRVVDGAPCAVSCSLKNAHNFLPFRRTQDVTNKDVDIGEKVIIGQRLITMKPTDSRLDRAFLKYMLMSGPLQQEIRKRATGATVLGMPTRHRKSARGTVTFHFP